MTEPVLFPWLFIGILALENRDSVIIILYFPQEAVTVRIAERVSPESRIRPGMEYQQVMLPVSLVCRSSCELK